jgi:O-antigen/teichoic acid export membrane protein
MFPAFSATFVRERSRTAFLYNRCVKYLFLFLFPIVLVIVGFSQDGLALWLGTEFAQHSYRVLQWLAVGVFLNCLAQVPFALLQGVGRPDLTAKMHLAELPCYILALWWLISAYGIVGAAMAWTCRSSVDALVLFGMAERFFPHSAILRRALGLLIALAFLFFGSLIVSQSLLVRSLFLLGAIGGFGLIGWFRVLSTEERGLAIGLVSSEGLIS